MVKRLIIMSDSHGDRQIVEEVKARYQGQVDAIFHNGDSELPADDPVWQGVHVVLGNCDWHAYPERSVISLDGLRIAQTHGHLYGINYGWDRLTYWAEEEEAAICLYGHLHVPAVELRSGILFLNPGSLTNPRGLIAERLYAKMDIFDDRYHIEFLTRDHQVYPTLTRDLPR